MFPMTRSFCFVIVICSLGLLFLNNSLPDPVDTGPIWTTNGATHEISTGPHHGNHSLPARLAAFGGSIEEHSRVELFLSRDRNAGCSISDFDRSGHGEPQESTHHRPTWIMLMRGECSFFEKIQNAQNAGYEGVLVGDDGSAFESLITMFARSAGNVTIPSLFVTYGSYASLHKATDQDVLNIEIHQSEIKTDWPLLDTLVFICFSPLCTLLIVYIVLFFRRRKIHLANILPPAYISKLQTVVYLPKDGVNADCVICLETFEDGEEVLELPCHHLYHDACIKKWLIERKKVCPICVRDVRLGIDIREGRIEESEIESEEVVDATHEHDATETTPLLASSRNVPVQGTATSEVIPPEFQRGVIAERASLRSSRSRSSLTTRD